jgi:malonyl-CoA/methylmalonyl-CoA synthetase
VDAQVGALHEAWRWTADDVILNVLPLHHIHGVINVAVCAATAGASLELCNGFDAAYTFDRQAAGCIVPLQPALDGLLGGCRYRLAGLQNVTRPAQPGTSDLTVFMAVPTVYSKLITEFEGRPRSARTTGGGYCAPSRGGAVSLWTTRSVGTNRMHFHRALPS